MAVQRLVSWDQRVRVEHFERAHERNGAQHERRRRARNGVVQQVHLGCGVDRDVAKRAQARVGLSKLRLQLCTGCIWCADHAQEVLHRGPDGRAQQVRAPRESGVGRCDECEWDVCEHQRGDDERGSLVYFQWSFDGAVHGFMIRLTSVLSDPPEDGRIIDSMRSLLSFFHLSHKFLFSLSAAGCQLGNDWSIARLTLLSARRSKSNLCKNRTTYSV